MFGRRMYRPYGRRFYGRPGWGRPFGFGVPFLLGVATANAFAPNYYQPYPYYPYY